MNSYEPFCFDANIEALTEDIQQRTTNGERILGTISAVQLTRAPTLRFGWVPLCCRFIPVLLASVATRGVVAWVAMHGLDELRLAPVETL